MENVFGLGFDLLLSVLTQGTAGEKDHGLKPKRLVLDGEPDLNAAYVQLSTAYLTLQNEVNSLKSQVEELTKQGSTGSTNTPAWTSGQGSTYVRWGRTVCPSNNTNRVYYGFAGGNFYTSRGGAADFLCLTSEPQWGVYDDSDQGSAVPIYGAEYQFGDAFNDGGAKFFGQNLQQHDAPCAVCHTARSSTLMIPGRNTCYPGWTEEYHGYLVSGRKDDPSATNYICLDANPEVEVGDASNQNGKLMEFVEAYCGTLKCPPYVQNRELTCVVCSK